MRIILTGVTGYIGGFILPSLLKAGHDLLCPVRSIERAEKKVGKHDRLQLVEVDFLNEESLEVIQGEFDAAYFLIHSMAATTGAYDTLEQQAAKNFQQMADRVGVKQVIYMGGISNDEHLSKHLSSRRQVEDQLEKGKYALTVLRAGIVIGKGSASFQIIQDLCRRLPLMVAPRWAKTRSQPISINEVEAYLVGVLANEDCYNKRFDIAGKDIMSYRNMLLGYAKVKGWNRRIWTVPVLTPRLSAYWLVFITRTNFNLALNLIESMTTEVIAKDNELSKMLNVEPLSYEEAVKEALKTS